jgi:hypothetical protein
MAKINPALGFALAALVPLTTTCSVVLDRDAIQCTTDDDCKKFDSTNSQHAVFCQQSVCVESSLGPRGCVRLTGTPASTSDYLNACTEAKSMSFDNCERLGLCGSGAALPEPQPPPTGGGLTATIKSVTPPTMRCAESAPNVIYMAGTSDFGPLLKQVTPLLTPNGYRAVYLNGTSCGGANAVFNPANFIIKDVPGTASKAANYAYYFDDDGNQVSCTLDPEGKTVDIGVSNLYSVVCDPTYVPGGSVASYLGPVVTFGFTVPAASKEQSISVEAAHLIFGLGGQNPAGATASPWIDPQYYSVRNSGAGSTALTAELIHVPRAAFWGVDRLTTDAIRDTLLQASDLDKSIGILSIDYADKNRDNLRVLYLQAQDQVSGFLPDSSSTSTNKANVRDGHYPLWGYVHFYTANVNGSPSPTAGAFVTRFSVPKLARELVAAMIDASLVPQCAMKVARDSEMGPFMPNPNKFQCGCFFDYHTTGRASCTTCTTANDCPANAPACNYGFCEQE